MPPSYALHNVSYQSYFKARGLKRRGRWGGERLNIGNQNETQEMFF